MIHESFDEDEQFKPDLGWALCQIFPYAIFLEWQKVLNNSVFHAVQYMCT